EVARPEELDRAPPVLGQPRDAGEGGETTIGPAPNPQSVRVEIGLPAHPLGDRSKVREVDPAPVAVDPRLPGLAIAGAPVDVGDDDGDASAEKLLQHRESEHRSRLA